MARLLALCSLPRTNQGDRLQYIRRNGPLTLVMTAGFNGCPTAPSRGCSWRGSAPKPSARNRAISSSAIRSPPSCGSWKSTTMAGRCVVGSKTRCGGCSIRTCSWSTKMPTAKRACIRRWPIGQSFGGTRNGPTIARCGKVRSGLGAFCRNSGALMRNWGVKTRGLICRGCTSSDTPSGRQWRLTRPEFAADAASVTAREQNCPVSPAGEQLGDRWYVAATKSGFQFTKRSNWSTVNARTPNIRWHSTLLWPRTRTCRAPNSSFSRPLTRSTVDRSR